MQNFISELICTRISHDIIGNIGAVANASELLEEGDLDFLDDIKSILKNSSFNLTSRMKFFRMAFGVDNNNLDNSEIVKQTTENYLASLGNSDYPISLSFAINNSQHHKTSMVMVMIMADLLIRGGNISVDDNDEKIIAKISTTNRISDEKWQKLQGLLQGNINCVDANTAHLAMLAEKYGLAKINLTNDGEFCRLMITQD